jgi:hypothetical protein
MPSRAAEHRGVESLVQQPPRAPLTDDEIAVMALRRALDWALRYSETLPGSVQAAGVLDPDEVQPEDDQLATAVQLLHSFEMELPTMLTAAIALAVRGGQSWRQIAQYLGCSRQAAQKRFSAAVTVEMHDPGFMTTQRPAGRRTRIGARSNAP